MKAIRGFGLRLLCDTGSWLRSLGGKGQSCAASTRNQTRSGRDCLGGLIRQAISSVGEFSWRGASKGVCGGLRDGNGKVEELVRSYGRLYRENQRGQRRRQGSRSERKRGREDGRHPPELELQAQNIIKEPPRVAVVGGEQGSGVELGGRESRPIQCCEDKSPSRALGYGTCILHQSPAPVMSSIVGGARQLRC